MRKRTPHSVGTAKIMKMVLITPIALVIGVVIFSSLPLNSSAISILDKKTFFAKPIKKIEIGHGLGAISVVEVKYKNNDCFKGEGETINIVYSWMSEAGNDIEEILTQKSRPILKMSIAIAEDTGLGRKLKSYPYQYWLEYFAVIKEDKEHLEKELLERLKRSQQQAKDLGS